MSNMNEIVKTLQDAVSRQTNQAKPTAYDTPAVVRRVEGDTAWVHIPDGVDETPVKLTIAAKEGDQVQVRVSGGSAFMVGNGTAPPTDDAKAKQAYTIATVAEGAAENALANANLAKEAADTARGEAIRAGEAADRAEGKADDAAGAATSAQQSADSALVNLSTVQDVVGVLNWITAHGTMTLTSDVAVNPAHVYFVVDAGGDYVVGGTHYSIVSEPKDAELSTYYELTVDESVQNYVATHIVVDSEGLWIVPDAGGNKVLIATGAGSTYTTAGTYIVGKVGGVDTVFAEFTASREQIGQDDNSHLSLDYHSMKMIDSGNLEYLHVSDLRDSTGTATVKEKAYIANTPYTYYLQFTAVNTNYSVKYGNTEITSGITKYSNRVKFNSNYPGYSPVTITYDSEDPDLKAFTFGERVPYHDDYPIGGMSFSSGVANSAEKYCSASMGYDCHARAEKSVALNSSTAQGMASLSEGLATIASGEASHAEGYDSHSDGDHSHAQNTGTIAAKNSQTALGTYNVEDTASTTTHPSGATSYGKYAAIIGNGTADNARSNALTVDWSGNIEAAGGADLAAMTESSGTYSGGLNDEALLTSATITKLTNWLNS